MRSPERNKRKFPSQVRLLLPGERPNITIKKLSWSTARKGKIETKRLIEGSVEKQSVFDSVVGGYCLCSCGVECKFIKLGCIVGGAFKSSLNLMNNLRLFG